MKWLGTWSSSACDDSNIHSNSCCKVYMVCRVLGVKVLFNCVVALGSQKIKQPTPQ